MSTSYYTRDQLKASRYHSAQNKFRFFSRPAALMLWSVEGIAYHLGWSVSFFHNDRTDMRLFDFDSYIDETGNYEAWGLGLHVICEAHNLPQRWRDVRNARAEAARGKRVGRDRRAMEAPWPTEWREV